MKKINDQEFKLFQEEFKKYQKLLNLQDYKVVFECRHIDGNFGQIQSNSEMRTAFVTLTNIVCSSDIEYFDIKETAKHEAMHLLLADITYLACERFGNLDTIKKEEEKIVRLLTEVVK
jgi:hypothetical protein